MSPPKRLTSVSFTSLLGTLLASAILFVLFVYPNPGGSVFSFLRLVVIVAVGYLFYHFYSGGDSREKAPLFGEGSRADPSQKGTRVKVVEMEQEAEKEFDRSSRSILELFVSGNPQFSAAVFLADRTGSQLARRVFTGETNAFRDRLSLENTAVGGLLTVDHVRFITPNDDEELFSTLFEDVAKLPPSTTVLVAPIAVDGSPRGVVLIHAGQFSDFDEHHRDLAASYSDLMGRNLKQLESLSSIRSDIRFFAHLDAFQSELEIVRSQDEMLSSFARFCGVNFDFDKLTVSTVDEARSGEAAVRVVSGFTLDVAGNESFSLSDSLHGRVISQGEPLRIDNLLEEPGIAGRFTAGDLEEHKFLSFLGVPIKYKKDVLGSLVLESFESNKYSDSDLKLLGVVGERAGTLLDWWRKYGVVREAARRDGLTGLLNHLSFMERFKEEISRANRYQESLVLLILDLDKFKRVNDSHGHLYGDQVLSEVADVLRKSVRNIDLVARYGGEEFGIILVNATKENTQQTCKRIVSNIAAHECRKGDVSVRITTSAGAAEFPSDGETPSELIEKADEAMYEVKRKGGNDVGFVSNGPS